MRHRTTKALIAIFVVSAFLFVQVGVPSLAAVLVVAAMFLAFFVLYRGVPLDAPSPRRASPDRQLSELLRLCHNDLEQAERLIAFEQGRTGCDRQKAVAYAVERLTFDRGR